MCADNHQETDAREHVVLLLRVARAYYEQGLDQSAIAAELGWSRSTISRLLSEARRMGVVRFQIGHPLEQAFDIERKLCRRFGLEHAWVSVPTEGQGVDESVGTLVAEVIQRHGNDHTMLALSNGTSVATVVRQMPRLDWPRSVVTQMIGSVGGTANHLVDSPELCRTLATRLGGTFRPLPVPIILSSASVARSVMREEMVLTSLELAARSDIAVLGVGTVGAKGRSGAILQPFMTPQDTDEVRRSKAVAHISGHHFDARGRHVHTSLCDRTIAMPPDRLRGIGMPIVTAWGLDKVPAIHAVLQAELGVALATDRVTAELLLSYDD